MNEKLKQKLDSAKQFVDDHKVAIAVTATALVGVAVNRRALKSHDDFLKEKGLYNEFYTPEDE